MTKTRTSQPVDGGLGDYPIVKGLRRDATCLQRYWDMEEGVHKECPRLLHGFIIRRDKDEVYHLCFRDIEHALLLLGAKNVHPIVLSAFHNQPVKVCVEEVDWSPKNHVVYRLVGEIEGGGE